MVKSCWQKQKLRPWHGCTSMQASIALLPSLSFQNKALTHFGMGNHGKRRLPEVRFQGEAAAFHKTEHQAELILRRTGIIRATTYYSSSSSSLSLCCLKDRILLSTCLFASFWWVPATVFLSRTCFLVHRLLPS